MLVNSFILARSIFNPSNVCGVPGDVASGKLHPELCDLLNINLLWIGQLDSEQTIWTWLVVEVREVGINLAFAHKHWG